MKRLEVLRKIDELQANHCKGCQLVIGMKPDDKARYCLSHCDVGQQIQRYGNQLLQNRKIKPAKPKEEPKVAMEVQGNPEEAKRLLKETDLSIPEIAKRSNMKYPTVYNYAKNIRASESEKEVAATVENSTEIEYLKSEKDKLEQKLLQYQTREREIQELMDMKTKQVDELKQELEDRSKLFYKQQEEIRDLSNQPSPENEEWQERYYKEKAKHDHLFQYISLL